MPLPDPPELTYNQSQGKITWDSVFDADSYLIYRSPAPPAPESWTLHYEGDATECVFDSTDPGIGSYLAIGKSKGENGGVGEGGEPIGCVVV